MLLPQLLYIFHSPRKTQQHERGRGNHKSPGLLVLLNAILTIVCFYFSLFHFGEEMLSKVVVLLC